MAAVSLRLSKISPLVAPPATSWPSTRYPEYRPICRNRMRLPRPAQPGRRIRRSGRLVLRVPSQMVLRFGSQEGHRWPKRMCESSLKSHYFCDARSRARLSRNTLTRGSPRKPSIRPSVCFLTIAHGLDLPSCLAPWPRAAPEIPPHPAKYRGRVRWPDDVTKSPGTDFCRIVRLVRLNGGRHRIDQFFAAGRQIGAGGIGRVIAVLRPGRAAWPVPRAFGCSGSLALAAEGRGWKYSGFENCWPISVEPITVSPFWIRLPFALCGKTSCATPVIANG